MEDRAQLEPAVPVGEDPNRYARMLARVHNATFSGDAPPGRPRQVINDSWQRVRRHGVSPDRGADAVPLPAEEVEHRRRSSRLGEVLPALRDGLLAVADDAAHIMVLVDAEGRVLWRDGSRSVRRQADGLGFVEGAAWNEDMVGTNAIGTALVERRPIQVYSAEHYVRSHHPWTCAAAPVHDPGDGALLGVVDVSGPAASVHPTTLALVDTVAKLAEMQLRTEHSRKLERLRAIAAPVLARLGGPGLVTDPHGWVAAASGMAPMSRLRVSDRVTPGHAWLPSLGSCLLEPLPGGWLIRPQSEDSSDAVTTVTLDLREHPVLRVHGDAGWEHRLTPRHAEILRVLAERPQGRSAPQLAEDLFADPARTVTVRAEMSRLRRNLGGLLDHRPYRFADHVRVMVTRG